MKKFFVYALFAIAMIIIGCKSNYPVAQQTGKEDMAYLVFVGARETYGNGSKLVLVDIDGTQFEAKVVKPKTANRKGTQYGVGTGNRKITVTFEGKTIYSKQLFLSSQETKVINLP